MNPPVKYVAEPRHVREVSLLGSADLAFWRRRLADENLKPAPFDGRAQILITAANMKYMGVRFRELSFSVAVMTPGESARARGAFLARAFNSCRFFAFCERAFFSTPYHHGEVRVSASPPVSIRLMWEGDCVFQAEMGTDGNRMREPSSCSEDGWEGPVFLPENADGRYRKGMYFLARIRGYTRTYPFLFAQDTVRIISSPAGEILQALIDSHFVSKEWAIREDATHAKSRTFSSSKSGPPRTL